MNFKKTLFTYLLSMLFSAMVLKGQSYRPPIFVQVFVADMEAQISDLTGISLYIFPKGCSNGKKTSIKGDALLYQMCYEDDLFVVPNFPGGKYCMHSSAKKQKVIDVNVDREQIPHRLLVIECNHPKKTLPILETIALEYRKKTNPFVSKIAQRRILIEGLEHKLKYKPKDCKLIVMIQRLDELLEEEYQKKDAVTFRINTKARSIVFDSYRPDSKTEEEKLADALIQIAEFEKAEEVYRNALNDPEYLDRSPEEKKALIYEGLRLADYLEDEEAIHVYKIAAAALGIATLIYVNQKVKKIKKAKPKIPESPVKAEPITDPIKYTDHEKEERDTLKIFGIPIRNFVVGLDLNAISATIGNYETTRRLPRPLGSITSVLDLDPAGSYTLLKRQYPAIKLSIPNYWGRSKIGFNLNRIRIQETDALGNILAGGTIPNLNTAYSTISTMVGNDFKIIGFKLWQFNADFSVGASMTIDIPLSVNRVNIELNASQIPNLISKNPWNMHCELNPKLGISLGRLEYSLQTSLALPLGTSFVIPTLPGLRLKAGVAFKVK